jgi:hypothetical protein
MMPHPRRRGEIEKNGAGYIFSEIVSGPNLT